MALQTPPIVWTIEQTLVTKLLQQSDTYDKWPVIQPSDITVTILPDNISTVVWPRVRLCCMTAFENILSENLKNFHGKIKKLMT